MKKQEEQKIREELFYDCLEDLVVTAELGHMAIDPKKHKDEIRGYINKTGDFLISKIKQREEEIVEMIEKMLLENPAEQYDEERAGFRQALEDLLKTLTYK